MEWEEDEAAAAEEGWTVDGRIDETDSKRRENKSLQFEDFSIKVLFWLESASK